MSLLTTACDALADADPEALLGCQFDLICRIVVIDVHLCDCGGLVDVVFVQQTWSVNGEIIMYTGEGDGHKDDKVKNAENSTDGVEGWRANHRRNCRDKPMKEELLSPMVTGSRTKMELVYPGTPHSNFAF